VPSLNKIDEKIKRYGTFKNNKMKFGQKESPVERSPLGTRKKISNLILPTMHISQFMKRKASRNKVERQNSYMVKSASK
jgi:hypothetical protein